MSYEMSTVSLGMRLTILFRAQEGWFQRICLKNSTRTQLRESLRFYRLPLCSSALSANSIRTSQIGGKSPLPFSPIVPSILASPKATTRATNSKTPKNQVFYAIVLHDFVAERADELDAKRGDPISVVAQSNREWFVAKPIGRLGRPGLIPVSFVEIRDPSTNQAIADVEALMDSGDLPKVEDWKRAMFNYKANSIALGVIEDTSVPNSPYMPQSDASTTVQDSQSYQDRYNAGPPSSTSPACLPEGILLSADVVSFHFEMEEFWFRIDATFQPYAPPGQRSLPPAKQLILFRVYNDFYDFQVSLLDTFPREAGRKPPNARMLPYMPGPADIVDQQITSTRRAELDDYLHKLCELSAAGARYILEHRVVREFLALKPGDVENETEPRDDLMEEIFGYQWADGNDFGNDMRQKMEQMKIREEDERSDGSDYDDEGYAPSPQRQNARHPYAQAAPPRRPAADPQNHSLHQKARSQNHQRKGSTAPPLRIPSPTPYRPSSQTDSPLVGNSPLPSRSYSPSRSDADNSNADSRSRWADPALPSPSSANSSNRSRSQSNAASNLNNPPISAANPQTAFVKIKIFDRVADDLIAIRVHPRVTHAELMDKIQARLGGEVGKLRYRDSLKYGAFVGLTGDDDLRVWLEGTDKHVLYAD
jgi:bud emergence protein 1